MKYEWKKQYIEVIIYMINFNEQLNLSLLISIRQ